jgi:hypothetical protein
MTLQEKNFSDSLTDGKRWIKTGLEVRHRDYPSRKMYVDQICKTVKIDNVGNKRTFIVGIDCHWLMESGDYGKGRFLTMELEPWKGESNG